VLTLGFQLVLNPHFDPSALPFVDLTPASLLLKLKGQTILNQVALGLGRTCNHGALY
jgi:hypothetical protein